MAKFYVGQRVKITGCANSNMSQHVGKCGVIVSKCGVYPDCWDVDVALTDINGKLCSWNSYRLEPILPSGAIPSEYSFTELMDKCRERIAA